MDVGIFEPAPVLRGHLLDKPEGLDDTEDFSGPVLVDTLDFVLHQPLEVSELLIPMLLEVTVQKVVDDYLMVKGDASHCNQREDIFIPC